jgi:hypothetical protein
MTESLLDFARRLGSNTVIGMAQKVGLPPPPPPISVRNLINLADPPLPLDPVDLQPKNGARDVSSDPLIFFRDPGIGSRKAAGQFEFFVTQNNVIVDPSHKVTGPGTIGNPVQPPGFKYFFPLPPGVVTLTVWGRNRLGKGPSSTSTFMVRSAPTPTPTPHPPPPHPPPPTTKTLTLKVVIASFGQQRGIDSVAMVITGPGAPAGSIPYQLSQDRSTATAVVPLPSPPSGQGAVSYTINGRAAFHYDGLINPNSGSISGHEDAGVDLTTPASIPWTGQSRVALFSITYDGPNNVFIMAFAGLL